MKPIVRIISLRKWFGRHPVIAGMDFEVNPGTCLAVVGPSGCGKTTLLRILSGELTPEDGSVLLATDGLKAQVSLVPQRDLLFPWRTLEQNALLGAEIAGRKSSAKIALGKLVRDLDLIDYISAYPHQLSGGTRQRASLARALLAEPNILLLDEALGQVDFLRKILLERLIREWAERNDRCVIMVTHDIESALAVSDRLLVLSSRPASVIFDLAIDRGSWSKDPLRIRGEALFSHYLSTILAALRMARK